MKRDVQLTKAAKFLDPRSFIVQNLHPNTNHACVYLKGKDVGPARLRIFERDKGRCQACGAWYGWDWGELHHLKGGLGLQRCWCPENLAWSCPKCHRSVHARPLWTPRTAA